MTGNHQSSAGKLAETSIYHGAVQKIKELTDCIAFIKKQATPQRVMEIGTALGGTFWLWCQMATESGLIISLDLPLARFSRDKKSYEKGRLQSYRKASQSLKFIKKNSHTDKAEALVKESLGEALLDILFIDGDHSYEGVKEDYIRYSKYVRKGGIIIFHDIVIHDQVPECQVYRFWQELQVDEETYEFIDPEWDDRGWGTWGGLGVMVKK